MWQQAGGEMPASERQLGWRACELGLARVRARVAARARVGARARGRPSAHPPRVVAKRRATDHVPRRWGRSGGCDEAL